MPPLRKELDQNATVVRYVGECEFGAVREYSDGTLRHRKDQVVYRCGTCERLTTYSDRCDNCWEVEVRLRQYLKAPRGWEFAQHLLAEVKPAGETPAKRRNP